MTQLLLSRDGDVHADITHTASIPAVCPVSLLLSHYPVVSSRPHPPPPHHHPSLRSHPNSPYLTLSGAALHLSLCLQANICCSSRQIPVFERGGIV